MFARDKHSCLFHSLVNFVVRQFYSNGPRQPVVPAGRFVRVFAEKSVNVNEPQNKRIKPVRIGFLFEPFILKFLCKKIMKRAIT
jgi:hypothetical protein